MFKLSRLQGDAWVAHEHASTYALPPVGAEHPRVTAGVPRGDPAVFRELCRCMAAPYFLLYVLHTPRGEADAGRYQSPLLSASELDAFVARFGALLSGDGRFDLWAHSPGDRATVVWDRHDQLFAYGPIARFVMTLERLGFVEGAVSVPAPHTHHYRGECDALAGELIGSYAWMQTPLRPGDEQ